MNDHKLSEAVNRSGFPLQIGLEYQINKTKCSHGWSVIYSEHSWKNNSDGCTGFIDLILEDKRGTLVLIVESKRVLESSWIFLIDDEKQMRRRHAKAWVTRFAGEKVAYFDFKELTLEPTTPQSQYCVVDGQDPKSKPMLERVASDVISSVEGFAAEENELQLINKALPRIYFGVVVTTAKLKVCLFDPANISLVDGKIQGADYKEVPYIRFRKQMRLISQSINSMDDCVLSGYKAIARAKESTVFVVNVEAFPRFLQEFEVD